ncbi:glycoside hydrolase family protein [Enterobacter rongchengensis]|uniref:Lysozyme n=1 Tax=Enterobacter rongchengensis TaxID=3030999 RepID=A0ABV4JFQ4_9ENTR
MKNLYKMIRQDEGEKLELYLDTEGYQTIGIGHLCVLSSSRQKAIEHLDKLLGRSTNGKITQQESEQLFAQDVQKSLREIERAGLMDIYTPSNEARRNALVNLMFNLGGPRLLGFKNALKAWRAKDYNKAADEFLDSKWARQVKSRSMRVTQCIRNGNMNSYGIR